MFARTSSILYIFILAFTAHFEAIMANDDYTSPHSDQEVQQHDSQSQDSSQYSQEQNEPSVRHEEVVEDIIKPIDPFTGKVVKNKVRLRLRPNLDSGIVKELNRSDLLIVVGENQDFYAVQPPAGIKAYVFRTFILDNVVEGKRVNVRIEPSTDAQVIAQLNDGDRVQGAVSPKNSKWYEINLPESTRLYVAKEYLEKIGDASLLSKLERRKDEVGKLLNAAYLTTQSELQKPFDQINFNTLAASYQKIIKDYQDFPEQVSQAKDLLVQAQDQYLKKKVAFLESERQSASDNLKSQNSQLSTEFQAQQEKIKQLEKQLNQSQPGTSVATYQSAPVSAGGSVLSEKMKSWQPTEEKLYSTWSSENSGASKDEFYNLQRQDALEIKGLVESYDRPVKNKPGDYVLINKSNNLPVAYLYSTIVNLQDYVGHEVNFLVAQRPNNNFAYPAYFVISVE